MSSKVSGFMQAIVLSLICAVAFSVPVQAGQGRGNGKGLGRGRINIERRDPTPGVPTSPFGRGRNYDPGIPRGRYIRQTATIRTRSRTFSVPRRVKRGRNYYPRTRRGPID